MRKHKGGEGGEGAPFSFPPPSLRDLELFQK